MSEKVEPGQTLATEKPEKSSYAAFAEKAGENAETMLAFSSHEELEKQLAEAEAKINEMKQNWLRSEAEMENLRRRAERDMANAHRFALEKFVNELLPIIDSLERGMQGEYQANELAQNLHKGMALTHDLFIAAIEKFNVAVIDPKGEAFNPEWHQAMAMRKVDGVKTNTVLEVMQKGYLLNGRLLRPALVVVAE